MESLTPFNTLIVFFLHITKTKKQMKKLFQITFIPITILLIGYALMLAFFEFVLYMAYHLM